MTSGRTSRLARSLWALTVALIGAGLIFLVLGWSTPLPDSFGVRGYPGLLALAFASVGGLIALHRPGHRIGQIFLSIGLIFGTQMLFQEYSVYTLVTRPEGLPGELIPAWIQAWIWVPGMVQTVVFLPLLFPTGQLLSPRWGFVGWLAVLGTLLSALGFALLPGPLANAAYVSNPVRIGGAETWAGALIGLGFSLLISSTILAATSLVVRFRRAKGDERQQLKWIASAGALLALAIAVDLPSDMLSGLSGGLYKPPEVLLLLAMTSLPIACGVAILKYRLYDIDLVIRRTIVYGTLTGALGLAYFASVTLLQELFRILTGQSSDLAIVVSTLVIAALLQPLRGRIQGFIDRHFYRREYDAARTLAAFGQTIRDEVDLEMMGERLVATVRETMQPSHVSLWLAEAERKT